MPIYEFACPHCRVIFNFLSQKLNPSRSPTCPKCGHNDLKKQVSAFSTPRGLKEPSAPSGENADSPAMPDPDDPRISRAMREIEQSMDYLDENNPKHMAYMMRKMKDILPPDAMPKEMEVAIKRLEAGEDPEKIEEDMGDALQDFMGGPGEEDAAGGSPGRGYSRDAGLYDY